MRFITQKRKSDLINLLVVLYCIGVFIFLIMFLVYKFFSGEFSPEDVKLLILGDPESFTEGMSVYEIVELVHTEAFFVIILLMSLFSINLRVKIPEKLQIGVFLTGFLSAFFYLLSPFFIKFVSHYFSYLYFTALLLFVIVSFTVNLLNMFSFAAGKVR